MITRDQIRDIIQSNCVDVCNTNAGVAADAILAKIEEANKPKKSVFQTQIGPVKVPEKPEREWPVYTHGQHGVYKWTDENCFQQVHEGFVCGNCERHINLTMHLECGWKIITEVEARSITGPLHKEVVPWTLEQIAENLPFAVKRKGSKQYRTVLGTTRTRVLVASCDGSTGSHITPQQLCDEYEQINGQPCGETK